MREELWLPAENGDATRAPFFILPYAEQSRACPRYANFIRADGGREGERGKRRGSKKHLLELGGMGWMVGGQISSSLSALADKCPRWKKLLGE